MFNTVVKNIAANYVGVFGQIAIAFFLSPFLVNTLGDTRYGIWSIVAALTGYMTMLDLGVGSAVMRFVAKHNANQDDHSLNETINSALFMFLVITVVLVVASPLTSNVIVGMLDVDDSYRDILRVIVIVVSFDVALFIITGLFKSTLNGFHRFEITNIAMLASTLYKALMFYWFVSRGYGLVAMSVISLSANLVMLAAFIVYMKKRYSQITIRPSYVKTSTIFDLARFGKFTFVSVVAQQLIFYSDAFVIGYFMSAAAVTYYTIPWSLTTYTNRLVVAVSRTFTPMFSELNETATKEGMFNAYVAGTRFVLFFSNLLCVGLLVMGDVFLSIWMGPKYAEICGPILLVLFLGQLIKSPQALSYSALQGVGKHRNFSYIQFAFSVLNLVLSIIFIQDYGLMGVAVSTAATQSIFFGLVVPWLTLGTLGYSKRAYLSQTFLPFIPTALLAAGLIYAFRTWSTPQGFSLLLLQAFATAIIYTAVTYLFVLNKTERSLLAGLVGSAARKFSRTGS